MFFEERLIFFPAPYPQGDWTVPVAAIEDAEFTAADGARLHGWFWPHPRARAVVLVAHGNAGNLTDRKYLLAALHAAGASALVFDYRGYGKSRGTPSEAGVLADARAARAWLARRTGLAENQIVLLGESLGGGVVVDLAAHDGAGGLILLGTFTSIPDVAAQAFPWLPVGRWLRTRFDSLAKIGRYPGPVLQFHGDADEVVPYRLAQRLFAAVTDPEKRFVTFAGGRHNDLPPSSFTHELAEFLARPVPSAAVPRNP